MTERDPELEKKARMITHKVMRVIYAVVILAFVSLAWYGAEMLLYQYCQPSIVKAFVAVCIAMSVSGRMYKEAVNNDRKRELAERIFKGIKEGQKEPDVR